MWRWCSCCSKKGSVSSRQTCQTKTLILLKLRTRRHDWPGWLRNLKDKSKASHISGYVLASAGRSGQEENLPNSVVSECRPFTENYFNLKGPGLQPPSSSPQVVVQRRPSTWTDIFRGFRSLCSDRGCYSNILHALPEGKMRLYRVQL